MLGIGANANRNFNTSRLMNSIEDSSDKISHSLFGISSSIEKSATKISNSIDEYNLDTKNISIRLYDINEKELPLTDLFTRTILLTQQLKSTFKNIEDNKTTMDLYELCRQILKDPKFDTLKLTLRCVPYDNLLFMRLNGLICQDNNFPLWILFDNKFYEMMSKEDHLPISDEDKYRLEKLKEPYKETIEFYKEHRLNRREYEIVQVLKQYTNKPIELSFHSKDSDIFKIGEYSLMIGVNLD